MIIFLFYLLSLIALLIGTGAIYMALIEVFPTSWLYYHYFIRKPINWTILLLLVGWTVFLFLQQDQFPFWSIPPLLITGLSMVLTYKMHQERAFPAVDFPGLADDPGKLPLEDTMQLAVIEYERETRCYPLDYVIHHHIINDTFGNRIVALTYCAMCRSIIPFDVTEIGPLFVGSFKNANMIVADRKTKTFFQQATFQSVIGRLHPHELKMIPFQILSWKEVKHTLENPRVVRVTEKDFREFQLPIPGVWKKIMATESTPGLKSGNRDNSFPARTHVIGIIDPSVQKSVVYMKNEVVEKGIVVNQDLGFVLIGTGDTVNGFKNLLDDADLDLSMKQTEIIDSRSGTHWNLRGKYVAGSLKKDLEPIALSDEYWFSWKRFHQNARLIRL